VAARQELVFQLLTQHGSEAAASSNLGNMAERLIIFCAVLISVFSSVLPCSMKEERLNFPDAFDAVFRAIPQIHLSVKLSVKRLKTVLFGNER
jgi:hypothetical protein